MGMYKYIREAWKRPKDMVHHRDRILKWRREPTTVRIKRPSRLDRARSLGYKAKEGFIIVRQRVLRGGSMRTKVGRRGRRPKHARLSQVTDKSYKQISEERANRQYTNCEVLNSYEVGKDGKNYWFEIILVDKNNPSIMKDKSVKWISESQHTGRVFRGLTSAGRKSRGLTKKGKGAEKVRKHS